MWTDLSRADQTNSRSLLFFLLPWSCMTDDGFPSAMLNRQADRQVEIRVRAVPRALGACMHRHPVPPSLITRTMSVVTSITGHRAFYRGGRERTISRGWAVVDLELPPFYTGSTTAHRVSFLIGKVFLTLHTIEKSAFRSRFTDSDDYQRGKDNVIATFVVKHALRNFKGLQL